MVGRLMAVATGAALICMPAQAACWNEDDISAATVRQLQSMMMVAALRCQVSGHDITAAYNGFVVGNRAAIGAMNDRLKAHFIHQLGAVAGQTAYDKFVTTLANGYGAAASGPEVCSGVASLAHEAAMMDNSVEGLIVLARREGIVATVSDGACPAPQTIASLLPGSRERPTQP